MAKKPATTGGGAKKADGSTSREKHETYKGHDIVIPRDDPGHRVLVDGQPLRFGRAGDKFYLDVYAYDPDPSLVAVVRRYIDYRDEAASRQTKEPGR
jgi:hypothetical protein